MPISANDTSALFDTLRVKDIFASDLGRIDLLGDNVRFVLYVDHFQDEGSPAEKQIVSKIVLPKRVVLSAIQRVAFALGAEMPAMPHPKMRMS